MRLNDSYVNGLEIDNSYVDDESIKIEIHKKINEINSYETLLEIKQELWDIQVF